MNIEEFLLSPDSLLTRVHFKKSKISAYETAEACSHRLSELQQQGASTAMFDSFSSQKAQILGGMVKKITWDGEPLVRAPYRKDWLYLEEKMVHLLNFIAWIGMFKEEVFRVSHWEQCLIRFCQHIGCAASAERALEPGPDKERVRHILNILIHTLDWIKKEHEAYEEDWKEPYLRKLAAQTEHDTSDNAIEENWNGLRVLEEGLAATPGHIGTLLTGSFAVESHRDSFSDLDVFAVFEQVPSDEMRDDLRLRLKVTNPLGSRTGGFEYFRLRQADIHFMVFERKHIDDTLTRFEQDGTQQTTIDFTSDETAWRYAPPAHRWLTGIILSDTDDILASFRRRAQYYPPILRESNLSKWTSVWNRYSKRFHEAHGKEDRLTSLTFLHYCTEAALRILLAKAEIHAEETDTKWLCREIEACSPEQIPQIARVLEVLPSDLSESPKERFDKTLSLWQIATRA